MIQTISSDNTIPHATHQSGLARNSEQECAADFSNKTFTCFETCRFVYNKHITTLNLSNVPLSNIDHDICLLTALRVLNISFCRNLTTLPSSCYLLSQLQCLDIRYTPLDKSALIPISDLPTSCEIVIEGLDLFASCSGKFTVEALFQQESVCATLNIHDHLYTSLSDWASAHTTTMIKCLTITEQERAYSMRMHILNVTIQTTITELNFYMLTDIRPLPEIFGHQAFQHVTHLVLYDFNMTHMPPALRMLESITSLKLKYCRLLKDLSMVVTSWPNLTILDITSCNSLTVKDVAYLSMMQKHCHLYHFDTVFDKIVPVQELNYILLEQLLTQPTIHEYLQVDMSDYVHK